MLSAQVILMRHEMRDNRAEFTRQIAILKRQIARMNNSVTRFLNRPAYPLQQSNAVARGDQAVVQLTHTLETQRAEPEAETERRSGDSGGSRSTRTESVPAVAAIRAAGMERGEIGRHRATETLEVVRNPVRIRHAHLSKCPRSLYDLWKEYMFGFSGNKPAREFTTSERGAVKHVYSKRNVFWMTVSDLIRSGWTSDRAIEKIYSVYGGSTCVTKVLKMLARDNRAGGHPDLRVRTA